MRLDRAWEAFDWFRGQNVLGVALCDPHTGGCRDGLLEDRANENQGAESTLAYLGALADMRLFELARPGTALGSPTDGAIVQPHTPPAQSSRRKSFTGNTRQGGS